LFPFDEGLLAARFDDEWLEATMTDMKITQVGSK
jgi:hypothetical protein